MISTIKDTRKPFFIIICYYTTYRRPLVQTFCVFIPVLPPFGVVQHDISSESEILARIIISAIYILRQLCQLRAVADQVRITLCTASTVEGRGHGAVPYFITCLRPQRGARHKEERQHGEPQDSHCFSCLCFLSHLFFI